MNRRSGTVALILAAVVLGAAGVAGASAAGSSETAGTTLSLEECVSLALRRSHSLSQAQERLLAAEGGVGVARAALLPRFSMSSAARQYSQDRIYYDIRGGDITEALPTTTNRDYNAGLSLSQAVLHGGGNWSNLNAASERRQGAREALRSERLGVVLRVTEAYLGFLRAEHLLRVAEETRRASAHRQERVEAMFSVGSVARADVLQIKVQSAQDELDLIRARNSVDLAQAGLLSVMGLSLDQPLSVHELPLEEESVPELRTLLEEANTANPSLGQLTRGVAAGKSDLSGVRAGRYPAVDLSWNYGWGYYRWPDSWDEWNDHADWTVTLSLGWSLFDGLATRSRISSARHSVLEAEHLLEQARLDVALEVKQQYSSLMEARERIKVAREAIAAAEEQLRLQEERYRLGAATLLELREAQVDLTRAKTSEVEARYDYLLAQARLRRAAGRG